MKRLWVPEFCNLAHSVYKRVVLSVRVTQQSNKLLQTAAVGQEQREVSLHKSRRSAAESELLRYLGHLYCSQMTISTLYLSKIKKSKNSTKHI